MTVEELFGTLQQSIVGAWRKHLRTAKYGKHEALDEFYKEMPDKVDALIEAWMGANGKKIGKFENKLDSANYNTLKYLGELKKICKQGYDVLGENDELKSLLDDIVNLINSTLYKVKELSESKGYKDLKDFINESLINEGFNWEWKRNKTKLKDTESAEEFIQNAIDDDSDYFAELANIAMDYIQSNSKDIESAKGNAKKLASICQASLEGELDGEDMEANCTSVMVALCLAAGHDYDEIDEYLSKNYADMHEYMVSMFH